MLLRIKALAMLAAIVVFGVGLVGGALQLLGRASAEPNEIVVGSKRFTESVILSEIIAQRLEAEGIHVRREFFLGGTQITFDALESGAVDLYTEYTGTGLVAILGQPPVSDPAAALAEVRRGFARYDVRWLDPLGFSDSYCLAMPRKRARALGIKRISDLIGRNDIGAGFASEFFARDDGWPGLRNRYGLSFAHGPVGMEAGLMYRAATLGQLDVISAYTTDGRLDALDFVVLDDDKHFFPPYQAAILVRNAALVRVPRAEGILDGLSGCIGEADMRRMNAEVDEGNLSAVEVARRFLATLVGSTCHETRP